MERLPDKIGPFEIRGLIGIGGMGVVYLAWDPRLNRSVALKTLRAEAGAEAEYDAHQLFMREARAVAAVSHPNIVQIFDIGEQDDGGVYFAMEYLSGKSLHHHLSERGRLPYKEALDVVRQAAMGLRAAAERGIIHRDVKPSNLVFADDGRVKVTDFGLAKQSMTDQSPAASTIFIGSATYLAPERATGQRADVRSDIYALGATLFELLTGRPPFEGNTAVAVIAKHLREAPPRLQQLVPDLPYPVGTFVQRTLAKAPEARPQDYDRFIDDIDELLTRPPRPATPSERSGTSLAVERSNSTGSRMLTVAVAVLVALGGLGVLRHLTREDEPATPALAAAEIAPAVEIPEERAPARPVTRPAPVERRPAPTPAPAPAPRKRAELVILENDHEITADGRLRVEGIVVNRGERRAGSARVRVALMVDGEEREVIEVPLVPAIVDPGGQASFEATLQSVANGGKLKFELEWLS